MLPKKNEIAIFSFISPFFSVKKAKKEPRAKRPNTVFRPTNLKRGQISEIWPKNDQSGNPLPWYLTQHRNIIELYCCIASETQKFFKRVFYLKQINYITGGPLAAGGEAIAPLASSFNPALGEAPLVQQRFCINQKSDEFVSVRHALRNDYLRILSCKIPIFTHRNLQVLDACHQPQVRRCSPC